MTTLAHHIDIDWLREAHPAHAQGRCNGIDGQTAEEYAAKLEDNLRSLLDRAKFGDAYRASPVRHHDVITLTVQRMHA